MIEHAIADLAAEAEGVEIEREIVEGTAAEVLVGAATGAFPPMVSEPRSAEDSGHRL